MLVGSVLVVEIASKLLLIDTQGSFVRHGLPRKQCEAEILAHLVAGSDTTANFVRMTLLLLATTPRIYNRLRQEINDGIVSGKISTPITGAEGKHSRIYRYVSVHNQSPCRSKKIQAFLWESLRYQPPVWMLFSKVVPPEGDKLGGKFVPGGTQIAIDTWSLGRRTDIYGEDVEVFRPERFLEASHEHRLHMERTTELIFGSGRYMCVGKVMAMLELNKVFVEVSGSPFGDRLAQGAPC
jgi:cytochrome P450